MTMATMKMNTNKRIPLRMCITCHQTMHKRQMIRLVRNVNGSVQFDTSGEKSGRGAYLCQSKECWHNAFKNNRLEHALKTNITPHDREQLVKSINDLVDDM